MTSAARRFDFSCLSLNGRAPTVRRHDEQVETLCPDTLFAEGESARRGCGGRGGGCVHLLLCVAWGSAAPQDEAYNAEPCMLIRSWPNLLFSRYIAKTRERVFLSRGHTRPTDQSTIPIAPRDTRLNGHRERFSGGCCMAYRSKLFWILCEKDALPQRRLRCNWTRYRSVARGKTCVIERHAAAVVGFSTYSLSFRHTPQHRNAMPAVTPLFVRSPLIASASATLHTQGWSSPPPRRRWRCRRRCWSWRKTRTGTRRSRAPSSSSAPTRTNRGR